MVYWNISMKFDRFFVLGREEWPLGVSVASSVAFLCFGRWMMGRLSNPLWLGFVCAWLIVVILGAVFCVVRHADHLAVRLGEPYGTLILTLVVTTIEVISISSLMLHEANSSTLVRDTLFAVVMLILNGIVGLSLLVGGWHHREQQYNLQGANTYLSVIIPLAVIGLILPSYTVTTAGPTLSAAQEAFVALMAVGLYGTFLAIQTNRHPRYFTLGESEEDGHETPPGVTRSPAAHAGILGAYMVTVLVLAKQLGQPVDYLIDTFHLPVALAGLLTAALVAAPEAIGAVRAAKANHLQHSVNVGLGATLAAIGLAIPTMLVIGHIIGKTITLGLEHANLVLLPLTLVVSIITFASGRTNILQGVVHLLLFALYIVLIFEG